MADSNNDRRRKMFSDRSEFGKAKANRRNSALARAVEARRIKNYHRQGIGIPVSIAG